MSDRIEDVMLTPKRDVVAQLTRWLLPLHRPLVFIVYGDMSLHRYPARWGTHEFQQCAQPECLENCWATLA